MQKVDYPVAKFTTYLQDSFKEENLILKAHFHFLVAPNPKLPFVAATSHDLPRVDPSHIQVPARLWKSRTVEFMLSQGLS
jgi:hypothetical protein